MINKWLSIILGTDLVIGEPDLFPNDNSLCWKELDKCKVLSLCICGTPSYSHATFITIYIGNQSSRLN